jgi:hypothetical protein
MLYAVPVGGIAAVPHELLLHIQGGGRQAKGGLNMVGFRKGLLVVLICALMMSMAPAATAMSTYGSVVGTWSGQSGYNFMLLALYDDGYYEIIILEQDGTEYDQYGYYSVDATTMYFSPNNSPTAAFSYYLAGDTLTLSSWQTGEVLYLTREVEEEEQRRQQTTVPAELVGVWSGPEGDDIMTLSLSSDFTFVMMHKSKEGYRSGEFSEYGGVLTLGFDDGASMKFKYMLSGDTLFLADEGSGLTVTLKRLPPDEVANLAATAAPEPVATPAPVPVETAAPEPVPASANLAGSWKGEAAGAPIAIMLSPDGKIGSLQAGASQTGSYTADESAIRASFEDGTALVYRFILMGDTLLLTDEQLGNPMTLTREVEPANVVEQPSEPADMLDPALFGTWGGYDKGEYGELTLTPEGTASMFIPSDPAGPMAGTYAASGGAIAIKLTDAEVQGTYEVAGDSFRFTHDDAVTEFTRLPGPLSRGTPVEEPVAGTVDAALVGTWGGSEAGAYGEITFSGGGKFSKFVPGDGVKSAEGTFMASGGNLAVLLPAGALQGTYAIDGDSLTIAWIGAEAVVYARQTGPLAR